MADPVVLKPPVGVWPVPRGILKCSGDGDHALRGTAPGVDEGALRGGVEREGVGEKPNGLVHFVDNVPTRALAGLCSTGGKDRIIYHLKY